MLVDEILRHPSQIVCVNGINRFVIEVKELNLSLAKAKAPLNVIIGNRRINTAQGMRNFLEAVGEKTIQEFATRYMRSAYFDGNVYKNHWYITRLSDERTFDDFFV